MTLARDFLSATVVGFLDEGFVTLPSPASALVVYYVENPQKHRWSGLCADLLSLPASIAMRSTLTRFLLMLGVGLVLAAAGCAASLERDPGRALRQRTFDYYWTGLGRNYKYFKHVGVDWNAVRETYRDRAINAPDTLAYYQAIASMVSELHDPHAYFHSNRFPSNVQESPYALDLYRTLDLRVVQVGGLHYLRNWGQSHAVPVGEDRAYPLLISAGGVLNQSVYTMASDVAHWANCDHDLTIQARYANGDVRRLDAAPDVTLRRLIDNPSSFTTILTAAPRGVLMAGTPLAVPALPEIEFTRISTTGSAFAEPRSARTVCDEVAAEATEVFVPAGRRIVINRQRPWWIAVHRGTGASTHTGYIRLSTFDYDVGRSERDFSGEIAQALTELSGVTSIIIDLRRNGGGVDIAVASVLAWFLPKEALPDAHARMKNLFNRAFYSKKGAFSGKVVLLVDDASASGAEVFAWVMRELRHCVLVGATTAGGGAGVRRMYGPDGSWLAYGGISLNKDFDPLFQTVGIAPDINIPLTIERVRELGYAAASAMVDIEQFEAACAAVGADPADFLGPR